MVERKASDLHITAGLPPCIRIDGEIVPMSYDVLKPQDCEQLAYSVLNDQQKKLLNRTGNLTSQYLYQTFQGSEEMFFVSVEMLLWFKADSF